MEINLEMDKLNSYIKIFDNLLDNKVYQSFLKVCKNDVNYKPSLISTVNGDIVDKKIRDVGTYSLSPLQNESMTLVHWASYTYFKFQTAVEDYKNFLNIVNTINIYDIQILKYKIEGHYDFHTDHGKRTPRTISLIYFLNDDYEGGDLIFKLCNTNQTTKIKKIKNRLIVWPSNFMFPHKVSPVTNGERYSVVAWAL